MLLKHDDVPFDRGEIVYCIQDRQRVPLSQDNAGDLAFSDVASILPMIGQLVKIVDHMIYAFIASDRKAPNKLAAPLLLYFPQSFTMWAATYSLL